MVTGGQLNNEVAVEVVVGASSGRGRIIVLRLAWLPADPLAVALQVTAQPDHPALPRGRWVILRDFLRYGLEEPTGDGDVRMRPDEQQDQLWFELLRGGRPCCVALPRHVVRGFLDETERWVPAGQEGDDRAVDALIDRLLQD